MMFLKRGLIVGMGFVLGSVSFTQSFAYDLPSNTQKSVTSPEDRRILDTFSKVFVNIADRSRPGVVYIEVEKNVQNSNGPRSLEDFFFGIPQNRGQRKAQGAGSGFIVDLKKGYVVTNNHVIEESDKITVTTYDGRKFSAKLVGAHPKTDIAVLELEKFTPKNLVQLNLADSKKVQVGDWVVAVGAPFNLKQTLTVGVVSALGRNLDDSSMLSDFIQTDAAINPGNSGGPLLNLDGEVIGVNSAIITNSGQSAGIGLAVPSDVTRQISVALINHGKIELGFLGVTMAPASEFDLKLNQDAVVLMDIVEGSPAEKAGLLAGDIILEINGKKAEAPVVVTREIQLKKPGTPIELKILRDGKEQTIKASTGAAPSETIAQGGGTSKSQYLIPGLQLEELSSQIRKDFNVNSRFGVVVMQIEPQSVGAQLGFKKGDVIFGVNNAKLENLKQLEAILKASEEQEVSLFFNIERNKRNMAIVFRRR